MSKMSDLRLVLNARGIYEICWSEHGRSKRKSTGLPDAAGAAEFMSTWLRQDDPASGRPPLSVADHLDAYRAEHVELNAVGRGAETADFAIRHLKEHFGRMSHTQITRASVRAYRLRRAGGEGAKDHGGPIGKGAGGPTVRRDLVVLNAALNHAAREGHIKKADLPLIELPPNGEPRGCWLTKPEFLRLAVTARAQRASRNPTRVERFLWIAYNTAGRRQAIETLEWQQVDFDLNVIHLAKPGEPKSKKRRATVAMNSRLRSFMLRAYAHRENDWVLGEPGSIRTVFRSLVALAGFKKNVTPNVLRHTAATHMLRHGVSLWDVAGVLGNSPAMIQKVYGKHTPEAQRAAVSKLR